MDINWKVTNQWFYKAFLVLIFIKFESNAEFLFMHYLIFIIVNKYKVKLSIIYISKTWMAHL